MNLPDALQAALVEAFPELQDVAGIPLVTADRHLPLATFLKQELGFTLYVTVVGSHWPGSDEQPAAYEIATVLRRPGKPSLTAEWRVRIPMDAAIPSLYPLFAGADWQEREQLDLVGVRFDHHPDPRRLMMPEDWQGHPLHRDYAIDTAHPPWR